MLAVVLVEKRWMIFVGLSRCGSWRWQPARHLVQGASNPRQGTDHARPPQSGLKPAARIARTALQQHLSSGTVAQGIPQPLASPGHVMALQRAAVVAAAGQEGDVVLACAHGDAAGGAAQAHGLIGGVQHRQLQLLQQGGQASGVLIAHADGLKFRGWWWFGW